MDASATLATPTSAGFLILSPQLADLFITTTAKSPNWLSKSRLQPISSTCCTDATPHPIATRFSSLVDTTRTS